MMLRLLRILYLGVMSVALCSITVVWYRNNVDWHAPWFDQCIIWARLAGIWLFLLFLFQLLSMCGSRFFDMVFTKPVLARMHKFTGLGFVLLLALHLGLMIPGKMGKHHLSFGSFIDAVLWEGGISKITAAGLAGLLAVWIFSILFVKKEIHARFWRFTHYLAYPAIALLFFHQILWGNDFQSSRTLTVFWSILFALVFADAIFWRLFSIHLRKR